ncbi:hypothetical protein [Nocardiopsis alba]|uniref:hypothetical protein n=1 Tax=Nocardiopsis alba TaxID=53437 RepID=UPI00362DEB71
MQELARTPGRAPGRTRARTRAKEVDLAQWSKLVNTEALKVRSAQRKLAQREQEMNEVLDQARAAGVNENLLSAWLVAAGLHMDDSN